MIILELNQNQKKQLEDILQNNSLEYQVFESKKLGGDEIIFQVIITTISIAAPYVIDFYKKSDQTNGHITFIKNGVKYIFESENDLKIFLDKQADN